MINNDKEEVTLFIMPFHQEEAVAIKISEQIFKRLSTFPTFRQLKSQRVNKFLPDDDLTGNI